ncbi:MAG: hypothetical protein LBU45_09290 [Azoarcus sp.]|jgi:hypothetical protein|nr:hypothetical protein [Azoarcus sp.]
MFVRLFPLLSRRLLVCVCLSLATLPAFAGDDSAAAPPPANAKSIEELRSEAESLREQADADYKIAEAACYKRFLVNSCIDDAKGERLTLIRQARVLEAEAHRLDLIERNRAAAETADKAAKHGIAQRPTNAAPQSGEIATPTPRAITTAGARKPTRANTRRNNARSRAEAARRAETALRDRERYDARIRELEEKKARDADGR